MLLRLIIMRNVKKMLAIIYSIKYLWLNDVKEDVHINIIFWPNMAEN